MIYWFWSLVFLLIDLFCRAEEQREVRGKYQEAGGVVGEMLRKVLLGQSTKEALLGIEIRVDDFEVHLVFLLLEVLMLL